MAKNSGINPAAGSSRSIGFQFCETIHLRAMMRSAIAINAENNSVGPAGVGDSGYRFSLPAIDLCDDGFHDWIAQLVLRIPPVERAQRFVDRIIRCFCLC